MSDILFESVLTQVCKTVAGWKRDYSWDIPVSVNLSAHQLRNHKLLETIKNGLKDEGVEQSLLNLELTETVLLEDPYDCGAGAPGPVRLWRRYSH